MQSSQTPRRRHPEALLRRGRDAQMRAWAVAVLVAGAAVAAAGCRHAEARALPEIPLDMPAPPPRVVQVSDPQPSPIVSLPEEPIQSAPSRQRQSPPARTETRPEPRPESAPVEVPRPEEPKASAAPTPTLQTVPAQQEGESERKVKQQLERARADLGRVNEQSLNSEARQQVETARRFVSQAEEALRLRNIVFASNLADKAASLAAQLVGR